MRRILVPVFFMFILCLAATAAACEKCGWYVNQIGEFCKYCIQDTACGYFQCEISQYGEMELCGSAWDAEGSNECFTEYGAAHNMCGPQQQVLATPPSQLRLVSVHVTKPMLSARGSRRHQKS